MTSDTCGIKLDDAPMYHPFTKKIANVFFSILKTSYCVMEISCVIAQSSRLWEVEKPSQLPLLSAEGKMIE